MSATENFLALCDDVARDLLEYTPEAEDRYPPGWRPAHALSEGQRLIVAATVRALEART